jgi:hypothetical protein
LPRASIKKESFSKDGLPDHEAQSLRCAPFARP